MFNSKYPIFILLTFLIIYIRTTPGQTPEPVKKQVLADTISGALPDSGSEPWADTLRSAPATPNARTRDGHIFQQIHRSIFTVYGDRGYGTGFLIDTVGMILTNEHVVRPGKYVRVQIDDTTRIKAKLISLSPDYDLALVSINPRFCRSLKALPLAKPGNKDIHVGDPVLACGNPLLQDATLTSGIISTIKDDVIYSDLNINPGNSGGPLLDSTGLVIGVTTFIKASQKGGAGFCGSVNIARADSIINIARPRIKIIPPPPPERLPVIPLEPFPVEALKKAVSVENFQERPYKVSKITPVANYTVNVVTPPYQYYRENRLKIQRSQKTNYDPFEDLKVWEADSYKPVVAIEIIPKVRQRTKVTPNYMGCLFGSSGYSNQYIYEYKGDLADLKLYRDNELQNDLLRHIEMRSIDFDFFDSKIQGHDMAQVGRFYYPVDIFKPVNGIYPNLTLEIIDTRKQGPALELTIPEMTMKQVWTDFMPYTGDTTVEPFALKPKKDRSCVHMGLLGTGIGILYLLLVIMG